MRLPGIPLNKTGTLFQRPAWRFEAAHKPRKFGLDAYLSDNEEDNKSAGCMRRLIGENFPVDVIQSYSPFMLQVYSALSGDLRNLFTKYLKRNFKKQYGIKLSFESPKRRLMVNWNRAAVMKLNDPWFRRFVLHRFNFEYDPYIAAALELYYAPHSSELIRFVGYSIFAGVSDKEITLRWNLPSVKTVEALRNLFFDFSVLPKDPVARQSSLRQLCKDGLFSEEDMMFYRRIYDLGELGLKAQVSFTHLDNQEKNRVGTYLEESLISTAFNINAAVKSVDDLMAYTQVLNSVSRVKLNLSTADKNSEEKKLTALHARQLSKELNVDTEVEVLPEDQHAFMEIVREFSKKDSSPEYIGIAELVATK